VLYLDATGAEGRSENIMQHQSAMAMGRITITLQPIRDRLAHRRSGGSRATSGALVQENKPLPTKILLPRTRSSH